MTIPLRMSALVLCVLLICVSQAQSAILYSLSNFNLTNQLHRIDTNDVTNPVLVGNTDVAAGFGLGDFNGRLFSFDQVSDEIKELNPNNGATINTQALGADEVGEGGITFDTTGTGYLTSSQQNTGRFRSFTFPGVGNTLIDNNLDPSMDGLDLQPVTGVLFGLNQTNNDLYTIDTNNGDTSLVGNTGILIGILAGLTFDASGALYGINETGALYTINPNNGSAALLGNTGLSDVSGLSALQRAQPIIPEPSTFVIWSVIGVVGLALVRNRRR